MNRRAHQGGISLVELMVALTLGLLVLLAGGVLLASANRNYLLHTEATRVDDAGRYAIEVLTRSVRQTSFVNLDSLEAPPLVVDAYAANIGGLDAQSLLSQADALERPMPDVANGSDVLALRFFGSGSTVSGDGSVTNCAGFGVGAADTEQERGWSIFYVGRGVGGETELRCKYRGAHSWTADALVRGVDSFQVLYGVDTDDPVDGVTDAYLTASELNTRDAALVLTGIDAAAREREHNRKTHWKRVTCVKVALLLHGAARSDSGFGPARFDLFGPSYSDANAQRDRGTRVLESAFAPDLRQRARQVFSATIMLRNSAL